MVITDQGTILIGPHLWSAQEQYLFPPEKVKRFLEAVESSGGLFDGSGLACQVGGVKKKMSEHGGHGEDLHLGHLHQPHRALFAPWRIVQPGNGATYSTSISNDLAGDLVSDPTRLARHLGIAGANIDHDGARFVVVGVHGEAATIGSFHYYCYSSQSSIFLREILPLMGFPLVMVFFAVTSKPIA